MPVLPRCQLWPPSSLSLLPQARIELPVGSAVVALEEDTRVPPGVDEPVALAQGEYPELLQRLIAALGQGDALGLLPLAGRIIGVEDLRPVEGVASRDQDATAARVTQRVLDRLP